MWATEFTRATRSPNAHHSNLEKHMLLTQDEWIDTYRKCDAIWFHGGNPRQPHALLTSGKHSDGFFNSELVLENPVLIDWACKDLFEKFCAVRDDRTAAPFVDRIVGPAMGAITLAHHMALVFSQNRANTTPCLRSYVEKDETAEGKIMAFKRTSIKPSDLAVVFEDVFTTGGSIGLTIDAIIRADARVYDKVLVLVNRSGQDTYQGRQIVSLIHREMKTWDSEECPLCKRGSEAIRPKALDNWQRLNETY